MNLLTVVYSSTEEDNCVYAIDDYMILNIRSYTYIIYPIPSDVNLRLEI